MTNKHPNERLSESDGRRPLLPFAKWWPLLIGAACGIIMRMIFSGEAGGAYAAMSTSFLYLSPVLVGMITVYCAERQFRRKWTYYLWAPMLANLLYVTGTLVALFEGIICAILIVPLFLILGMVGGVLMGTVCRLTNWPRSTLSTFAVAPLILGALEPMAPLPQKIGTVERQIEIQAPPADVWRFLEDAQNIQPKEVQDAWMYRIGVPLPLGGDTEQVGEGHIRRVNMGKHIYFDQVADV